MQILTLQAVFRKKWMQNSAGEAQLFSLAEKGAGAIDLHHIESPFSVKDSENNLLGQVRNSSVVIGENGLTGAVQQLA